MKRFFKSIGKKRGSVLFMVLTIMSLMIVLASAVYFTVVSSQKTQLTDLYDEQAYQSALSVSDVLTQYLTHANSSDNLMKMVYGMTTAGDSITTGSNDFMAFGGSEEQLSQVGAFKSTITYLGKHQDTSGNDVMEYDVSVTTNYNDIEETVHTIMTFVEQKNAPPSFDRFFTATGYSTGDVYVEKGIIASNSFFDNEYTIFRKGYNVTTGDQDGSGEVGIFGSIWCGGSLRFDSSSANIKRFNLPMDIIVLNDLFFTNTDMLKNLQNGSVFVGGDAILGGRLEGVKGLYVLGDLTIKSDFNWDIADQQIYVGGDLILEAGNNKTFFVNGNLKTVTNTGGITKLYCKANTSGVSIPNGACVETGSSNNWDPSGGNSKRYNQPLELSMSGVLTQYKTYNINVSDIESMMGDLLSKQSYPQWNPTDGPNLGTPINFSYFKATPTAAQSIYVISNSCKIEKDDISIEGDGWDNDHVPTIVIYNPSTTPYDQLQESDTLVVTLEANCVKSHGSYTTFTWAGHDSNGDPNYQNVNVIVVGKGPVLIELEGDTQYFQNDYDFMGHLGFYSVLTSYSSGTNIPKADLINLENIAKTTGTNGFILDSSLFMRQKNNIFQNMDLNYQNPSDYSDKMSSKFVYSYAQRHNITSGGVTCEKVDANGDCDHTFCLNVQNVKNAFPSLYIPDDMHNNIFLISTSINANFNFYGSSGFFGGYIYAPYMRFDTSLYTGVTPTLALAGGMIVSDYCINDGRGYLFVKCDVNLAKLAGFNNGNPLLPTTSKVWKRTTY